MGHRCRGTAVFGTLEAATRHARETERRAELPAFAMRPYRCERCSCYHVRKRPDFGAWMARMTEWRFDLATFVELGDRVYAHCKAENVGSTFRRQAHVEKIARTALKKAKQRSACAHVATDPATPPITIARRSTRVAPRKRRKIGPNTVRKLIERDGLWCTYCRVAISIAHPRRGARLTVDHKVPIVRGGSDRIVNLVLACSVCNGLKGEMTVEEFEASRALRNRRDVVQRRATQRRAS